MSDGKQDAERDYDSSEAFFGEAPDPLLRRHVGLLDHRATVLDLGAGQGRNALYLARLGLPVLAADPSPLACQQLRARAKGLPITVQALGFAELTIEPASLGAALVFGLLPLLPRDEIERLMLALRRWLAPGGLLLITAFTDALGGGRFPTYLRAGEILDLLPDTERIEHREYVGDEHRHGDGPLHRHAWAEAILRLS